MDRGERDYFYKLAGFFLVADQISKSLISHFISFSSSIAIIPGFFNLTHILNPGAAFGFLSTGGASYRNPFFIGISLLALVFILYYYYRRGRSRPLCGAGLGMIAGGAAGNLLDRLLQGAVVDFLDFHIGRLHWPAFNLADSAITVGVALLVWDLWREAGESS